MNNLNEIYVATKDKEYILDSASIWVMTIYYKV